MSIEENTLIAILGPSNTEKKTFLKLFNRLNETQPGYKQTGSLMFHNKKLKDIDINLLRRKVGFVFSQPVALHGSIFDNLIFGLQILKISDQNILLTKVKEVLSMYKLWDYFKNDLDVSAQKLKPFKLQILALARVLVLNPEIILMEQPTKFLSELASRRFETIILGLKKNHTIIIDTENIQQARRMSDYTAFIYNGKIIEYDTTQKIFTYPTHELTENYIRGKFE